MCKIDGVLVKMKSDFILAFNEIAETRKLPREVILDALSAALVSAYRRNSGAVSGQHVEARIDEKTGEADIWVEKEVVAAAVKLSLRCPLKQTFL